MTNLIGSNRIFACVITSLFSLSPSLDFCNRFQVLLSYQFSEFPASLALSLVQEKEVKSHELSHDQLMTHFNQYDLKRLELYSRNMADYHLVTDMIPKR